MICSLVGAVIGASFLLSATVAIDDRYNNEEGKRALHRSSVACSFCSRARGRVKIQRLFQPRFAGNCLFLKALFH
jgi:hypothetical protein